MRIRINKGMTPEDMADMFVKLMRNRDAIIGTVNIYVQEFDDNMRPVQDGDFVEVKPTKYGMSRYEEYSTELRRSKLRVV